MDAAAGTRYLVVVNVGTRPVLIERLLVRRWWFGDPIPPPQGAPGRLHLNKGSVSDCMLEPAPSRSEIALARME